MWRMRVGPGVEGDRDVSVWCVVCAGVCVCRVLVCVGAGAPARGEWGCGAGGWARRQPGGGSRVSGGLGDRVEDGELCRIGRHRMWAGRGGGGTVDIGGAWGYLGGAAGNKKSRGGVKCQCFLSSVAVGVTG